MFLLENLGIRLFIYVSMSVCVFDCMHATLSNCVYACACVCVSFKSVGVRVSHMCLHVLNLSGPRLPEAGFFIGFLYNKADLIKFSFIRGM